MNRTRYIVLTVLGVLLTANVIIFFSYRVRQQERVNELHAKREQLEAQLLDASNVRASKERQLKAYLETIDTVNEVLSKRWATPKERLVPLILEVRSLAEKSRLRPSSISYSATEPTKNSDVTTIDISFGVQGSYEQVRKLVHMIEHSRQFVYIDEISLTGSEESTLQLNLRLKTLFRSPEQDESGSAL